MCVHIRYKFDYSSNHHIEIKFMCIVEMNVLTNNLVIV
jgi:hypothetical protein